ncbi:MAG: ribokinase [Bifidobacteriaceae bacterium]|jgi:ribokinase|nr:ribokinase [Bifidobacteriaceae bacterium]
MRARTGEQLMRIAVVGSYGVGFTVQSARLPIAGETILGTGFTQGPGGKGSNQAVAAARLGAEVSFLTALGEDEYAAAARRLWQTERINVEAVLSIKQSHTMAAWIVVEPSGDNRIIVVPGALDYLTPAAVRGFTSQIVAADVLMTSFEIPLEAAIEALRIGRQAGTTTLLNPAPARTLPDEAWDLIDVVTPNQTEAAVLLGLDPQAVPDQASLATELARRVGRAAVMTLGGQGALLAQAGELLAVPAVPVERVVDTTGCGDAFSGALAVGLAQGRPLPDAVRLATAAGAHAASIAEVVPSLPTWDQLKGWKQ